MSGRAVLCKEDINLDVCVGEVLAVFLHGQLLTVCHLILKNLSSETKHLDRRELTCSHLLRNNKDWKEKRREEEKREEKYRGEEEEKEEKQRKQEEEREAR